ncbi:isoleucine--tRNA ligase [Flammeovirga kamogawensis]|uniref:Isoleucine--tRNA ligase n=1 Tax=Flammeovirga kamogawensis TaxID=373891 RepID=A0ABX8GWQ0_9BACT|nr:isoleucine--tRNA ligase [Flammeovirga kamogawensis]MBB6460980.1 isoleucyl-tRNA synthetase [Flammeovirga kamogawensis]QWG07552.1 isoleucine--tRNA ligase [Flammeovirga kamogawensis]TRX69364.1 isoleucine--tRNA ligase [Flammeovirga kamogawensis]
MGFKEYKGLDLVAANKEIRKYWEENNIFDKSVSTRSGNPSFVFYEGPPSANGAPGIHHVMGRAVKDLFNRYKTLKGFEVKRKAGWDTHGLPVELKVEKELGITKEDIGKKISVDDYNAACRKTVMEFKEQWDELTRQMGYWVDLDTPYITFEKNYMESVWYLLKELYKKDLIYKGYTIQPFSPAAGTGLSSHELNQPGAYRDVTDTTITAQFKVVKDDNSSALFSDVHGDLFFLAWTTTPWTLSSNAALAVGNNIDYVKVQTYNAYTHEPVTVILAKNRLNAYINKKQLDADFDAYEAGTKLIPARVVGEVKGKDLVGAKYEQLLPYVTPEGKAFEVIPGDFVTTEDGTGIVHIAPTFGADDQRVANLAGIAPVVVFDEKGEPLPLVDKTGRFVKEMGEFGEQFIKAEYEGDAVTADKSYKSMDVRLAIKLKTENRAFLVAKYVHSYPHCWRTDKPVLYYPLDSWFIRTTAVKDRLVELNKTINWKPKATGEGRFGNWLENLVDWNLSRSRYWGTPLPIWRTEDGTEEICIGSVAELGEEVKKAVKAGVMPRDPKYITKDDELTEEFDLHRPYVDDIVLVSKNGVPMKRELDLIDVWFDSGAMPYAQWHYPFENKEIFKGSFPADFIAEGVDQTRGWFFTLHAIAGMTQDSIAYKNVVSNGLVLDAKGAKMSKRVGNVINPFETMDEHGADATRWYMISNANPWDNLKFDLEGVKETKRKFFGTLYNTYSFFSLYANLDNFTYSEAEIPMEERQESDRWILSRLNTLIKEVDEALNEYEPTKAARAIQTFTLEDMSNWYVRLNRKRFWKGDYATDKISAYQTLYTCLETISQLMSPIAPFFSDRLFQDLNAATKKDTSESVHISNFPEVNEALIDVDLEEKMRLAQVISSLTHSIRKKEKLKVRQPLQRILIPDVNAKVTAQIKAVQDVIASEVNIKEIDFLTEENEGMFVKHIKPNFATLGRKYGKLMKGISAQINQMSQDDIKAIETNKGTTLDVDGNEVVLGIEDVLITSDDIPGWSMAKDQGVTVALDITLTEELKKEGIARDIVNRVQNIRKELGLEVQDKINIVAEKGDELVNAALATFGSYICDETQALSLTVEDTVTNAIVVDLDGVEVKLSVSK